MKAPNVLSIVAMLVVVLPSVALAISQQFPEAEYWWAALITAIIGGVVKGLQVWMAQRKAPPAHLMGVDQEIAPGMTVTMYPEPRPSLLKQLLKD